MKKQFTKRDVEAGIRKVGAGKHGGGRHDIYVYSDEDAGIAFHIAVPRHTGNIPKGTVQSIARQFQLDRSEFSDLVECPLSAQEYARRVRSRLGNE